MNNYQIFNFRIIKNRYLYIFILLTLTLSCKNSNASAKSDPICDCYRQFVEKVKESKLNYEDPSIETSLLNIYNSLSNENPRFQKCIDNSIIDGDLFSKSKLRIYQDINPNCVEQDEFNKIIENGPYIYKTY